MRDWSRLTGDERRVVELVALHFTDAEIANRLLLSEGTVHRRVRSILDKLRFDDRREAGREWLASAGLRPFEPPVAPKVELPLPTKRVQNVTDPKEVNAPCADYENEDGRCGSHSPP